MKTRIGLYPGSFNPFHTGHLDIVRQAQRVFGEVIVVRAINPSKKAPDADMPKDFLNEMKVQVEESNDLVTDLIKDFEKRGHDVTLIRGLRSGNDLAYEQNLVAFMRNMHPSLKLVFFLCDPKFQHISSSALRDIRKFSEEEYKRYAIEG